MNVKKWLSPMPEKCQCCGKKFNNGDSFSDCSVPIFGGSWALICDECFTTNRCKLGLGRGQRYTIEK
jgi:hypothetical protein